MAISRYARTPRLDLGSQFGTAIGVQNIRAAIKSGAMPVKTITLRGAERLDTLAGMLYNDSRYWWVLAAASNIGWGLQLPPGTVISIPDLADISRIITG
jgi:hypothetical protein